LNELERISIFLAFSLADIDVRVCLVIPFGRVYPIRQDLLAAARSKEEGGNGTAKAFWEWSEEQVKAYLF
jgi:hypothetical protein